MYIYRKLTPQEKAELVQLRLSRGYPPHSPPHTIRDNKLYLITAACYEHKHHMSTEARRQQLLDMLFEELVNNDVEILAWVVLPNHYHVLVYVENFDSLGKSLRIVHGKTSRYWNLDDNITGRKVWYSYFDRAIRSERHYNATINYIHRNPVKHLWTKSEFDWNQTSVHWYLQEHGEQWLLDRLVEYPVEDYDGDWDV
ncbi:hypothetical protein DSM106972_012120 [Dulcicalothrix desertica PCC 7102]|uniref:Transposase IS200-like domain-containing protein n=1 Tax=Dulcicalothrix desertica PCC 7102 TaxID=232991 RepID=A0A3S1DFZ7_9CYAN|nr:transposase [Dulcicalothrix desertica]RUT09159.1 hypothetical protein DSM106972_012120 [Dulcicalothrix desertica PCC 7102]TWH55088.1 putative transposase [Dulcicalothrix desertica PCC 7102]